MDSIDTVIHELVSEFRKIEETVIPLRGQIAELNEELRESETRMQMLRETAKSLKTLKYGPPSEWPEGEEI